MASISMRLMTSHGAIYSRTAYGTLTGVATSIITKIGENVFQNVFIGGIAGAVSGVSAGYLLYHSPDVVEPNLCSCFVAEGIGFCASWATTSTTMISLNLKAACIKGLIYSGVSAGVGICSILSIEAFRSIRSAHRNHTPLAHIFINLASPPVPPIAMSRE